MPKNTAAERQGRDVNQPPSRQEKPTNGSTVNSTESQAERREDAEQAERVQNETAERQPSSKL